MQAINLGLGFFRLVPSKLEPTSAAVVPGSPHDRSQEIALVAEPRISETYPCPTCFEQAIGADNGELAAKIIQDALGIESDDVGNYCFLKTWPADRERRARIIGEVVPDRSALPSLNLTVPAAQRCDKNKHKGGF